ncbi:hypothetical protein BN10_590016 [Phycicoccus elongatus Lp2]|uniref:Uncharacterized protein n=1 Tax=Phycicoccus elongatus Lp2 TaxID=1193181 RepID=N0E5H0_9MICO|nr:hypothetical protein BN10_590016 [Phycicoccus elongatus Lp2]
MDIKFIALGRGPRSDQFERRTYRWSVIVGPVFVCSLLRTRISTKGFVVDHQDRLKELQHLAPYVKLKSRRHLKPRSRPEERSRTELLDPRRGRRG